MIVDIIARFIEDYTDDYWIKKDGDKIIVDVKGYKKEFNVNQCVMELFKELKGFIEGAL